MSRTGGNPVPKLPVEPAPEIPAKPHFLFQTVGKYRSEKLKELIGPGETE